MDWNVIGHQQITYFLETAIKNNQLAHSYLFSGSSQLGKKTVVKKFINSILCYHNDPNKKQIPCGVCDACHNLAKKNHPDIFYVKKEAAKKDITIEQIRELENNLAGHSFFKSYKIALLEGVENLNPASANALLKTLEEPRPKTIIILLANKLGTLPPTILSRTQIIKFLPVSSTEIFNHLLNTGYDRSLARQLASVSVGRPGRALTLAKSETLWQSYLAQVQTFFSLIKSSPVSRLKFAARFLGNPGSLTEKTKLLLPLLNLWQLLWRDLLLSHLGQENKITNIKEINTIQGLGKKYSLQQLISLQKYLETSKKNLNLNVNPRLVLENLLLQF